MVAERLVLLQPTCPPSDDPEISRLLGLLGETTASQWIELDLCWDVSGQREHYSWGTPDGTPAFSISLDCAQGLTATLRLKRGIAETSSALSQLGALALEKILLARRLHEQAALLRGALDTTTSAVLLFDQAGDIVYANPPGDRLLSRQTEDGLVVVVNDQRTQPLFTLLCSLVERMANMPEPSLAWNGTLALSDGSVLACEILRVHIFESNHQSGVLALLQTVNAEPQRRLEAFCASHRLSPREEEVVRLMIEGLSTSDIAARLNISRHTVRDHLKHLYRKTDTKSRSELLGLLTHATAAPPLHRTKAGRP